MFSTHDILLLGVNSRGQHFHTFAVTLANQTFLLVDPPAINPVTSLQLGHTRSPRPAWRQSHVWILPGLNRRWRDSDRKLRPLIVPRAPLGWPLWKTRGPRQRKTIPCFQRCSATTEPLTEPRQPRQKPKTLSGETSGRIIRSPALLFTTLEMIIYKVSRHSSISD